MFQPQFTVTLKIAKSLMEIEAARQSIADLDVGEDARKRFAKTAQMFSAYYSTKLEGSPLTWEQAVEVISQYANSPRTKVGGGGVDELLGYYRALKQLGKLKRKGYVFCEARINILHASITESAVCDPKATFYRLDQNLIQDSPAAKMLYLPPEPKDVSVLVRDFVKWNEANKKEIPCPLRAGIAQYQFMTIQPFNTANGRTARFLSSLILWLGDYDLKGFCSLEEHYARDPAAYYKLIALDPPHNFLERTGTDMTPWLEYFCAGMAASFASVASTVRNEMHTQGFDQKVSEWLDWRQRKVLSLFNRRKEVKTSQVAELLNMNERTVRSLCQKWVDGEFLKITVEANKKRRYALHDNYNRRRSMKRAA
jgi:Fic family protein